MKVRELLEILNSIDTDLEVIAQNTNRSDTYSPIDDYSLGVYSPKDASSGKYTIYGEYRRYTKEEANSICLFPID